jgi:Flp pilus assembly protein CpaB
MKRGMGFYIIIGVAILLGLVVMAFFSGLANTEQVVVAARPLSAGTRIHPDDIEIKEIHATAVLEGAFTNPDDVLGQLLSTPRLPGEQIAASMLGSKAINAIAATLDPDWRAVGVNLSKAQGVAGVLRPGDSVDVVGILDTSTLMQTFGFSAAANAGADKEEGKETPLDPGVLSRVVLKDAKVALVPQSFRYEELPEAGEEGLSLVQAGAAASRDGDVVLAVPATPITITLSVTGTQEVEASPYSSVVGLLDETQVVTPTVVTISPVELLALLDAKGEIYLALAPEQRADVDTPGLTMRDLVLWLTPRGEVEAED